MNLKSTLSRTTTMSVGTKITIAVTSVISIVCFSLGAYLHGEQQGRDENRVTLNDIEQFQHCMAYYNDASHCWYDVIGSWQK